MLFNLLFKMLNILVLCRVLLIAGVQTLTIDSQLGTSIEDCFERISIGEQLPVDAIYRNVSELTNRECEQICKQDKQCQAYDYGVGAKGNATCNLSTLDEKTIKEQNPLKRHPDYDVYIRRFQCEQSPPTPIQPLNDDPGSGSHHRPVFRPEIDDRPPSAEDYLISADIGYGKPPDSHYRPDDGSNNKPDFDVGPSYGDHKPQDIAYKPSRPQDPERPNDSNRPERPNAPYRPIRPNDKYRPNEPYRPEKPYDSYRPEQTINPYRPERPQKPFYSPERPSDTQYGSDRPQDPYRPNDTQRPGRPEPNDVLQFQGIGKPRPPADEYNRPDPYKPDKPDYHYIIRPNRKPRPQGGYTSKPDPYFDGHLSEPIGPPNRPYRPNRPYDKPTYNYDDQYASSYGQNSHNDNSIHVEIYDPPRPYIPIKDRPNQHYNGQGYLGYGTYSSQNSYSQSQNDQYTGTITQISGYDQNDRPNDRPQKPRPPVYDERPQKPGYGTLNSNGYGSSNSQRPNDYEKPAYSNQGSYGSNDSSYGSNQGTYNSNHGNNHNNFNSQGDYAGNRPVSDHSNYGETGYGPPTQRPGHKPSHSNQGSYGHQNSNFGSYGSSHNDLSTHQTSYGSYGTFESYRPPNNHLDGYGQSGYQKPHKPSHSNDKPYISSQDSYGSNHDGYGSTQSSHGSSSNSYGNNQGSYGSSNYGNNQGSSHGSYSGQSGHGTQSSYGQGDYGSSQGYGNSQGFNDRPQGSYGDSQGGYGFSHGYGSSQNHGESQYADHSSYGGYGNQPSHDHRPGYGNHRPDYSNRPDFDYERPHYENQKPGYSNQKPVHDSQTTGYGQKPSQDSQTGYEQKPVYDNPKPGYNDPKPVYNDPKPSNDPKPGYSDEPELDFRPDVKPVYEYEIEKPNNVPAYIAKPGGDVVTSRPVVIGDYGEKPVYKEPGVPGKDVSYKACFRRVLAGQRALRSFVRKVVPCERLDDCRRECAEEKRFHCESFNYRLDPSFRGKGLCELMTRPIESFDILRDFVQDRDYDFYEIDRNSLEPNCPETIRGPGLLHSGFLGSKGRPDRLDDRTSRPNRLEGWRDRNDWIGDRGSEFTFSGGHKGGNRRYEDRVFIPYQIGIGRPKDDHGNWGQYGGNYGGSQYYKNRNDYDKSIHYWGLTSERPIYGVKQFQYDHHYFDHSKDRNDFDYHSSGKDLRHYFESHSGNDKNVFNYFSLGKDRDYDNHRHFNYHGRDQSIFDHKSAHGIKFEFPPEKDYFDYHSLGKEGKETSDEDYYGVGKVLYTYGNGAWKKGKWNSSGVSNVLDEEDLSKIYYEAADRSDDSDAKDCFSRRRPGMSLGTGAIRRSLVAWNVVACETACFSEKEFKCVSYSYRYSNTRGTDNCFLSERTFHGLDLSADSGSDVYAMPQDKGCSATTHTPWIESECFYHVRSDTVVSGSAVKSTLTVAGLGACEAECIRAQGFFCRGFSFRFDSPIIGEELHNCILTSSPTTSLSGDEARRAGGHELYARGNYGRGCEPQAQDVKDNGECYLQYDKASKLTPSAIRGHARVEDDKTCRTICTKASFRCLSFSYKNNAPPYEDNCHLSEIRLFDLQKDVDYVHSEDDWLFAFDVFNSECLKRLHAEEPSSEIPHPIHTSSEEDTFSSGPSSPGYLPEHPPHPPGPPEIHIPGSVPSSGQSYHPHPPKPEYKPSFRPDPESQPGYRPDEPFRPPEHEGYKPFRPEPRPDYQPELPGPYKPAFRPESYPIKPVESGFRPGSSGSGFVPGSGGSSFIPGPSGSGFKPEYGTSGTSGYLPEDRRPEYRPQRPESEGDREGGSLEVSWRHYTVSGFPCRTGTTCAQNIIAGHWACEPEGGEIGSWDYCCAPSHRCGYSEGFHKPWCYVGPKAEQWRPCSEKYYPYHQHNVPHPSSQGHREDYKPPSRPWRDTPPYKPDYIPHWDKRPGPYLSAADKQYWDDLYENGPKAYYDKYGNPLPGYSRVPTENRPRIKNRYNPNRPGSGSWVPVSHEDPTGVPGSLGAPRYWPVAYLHKDPPPNMTYFRYNETRPTTTTENYDRTPTPQVSREMPSEPRIFDKPDDLDAKSSRDDKKINISKSDDEISEVRDNDTIANTSTTTEVAPVEEKVNVSKVETIKTESYKEIERYDGIDDKLDDFSKSIEVLDIEDVKGDKISNLKTLEAEERQIEAIGRLLASRRGTQLVLEKRSQKDLENKNIAIDKDLLDFNFGNRFPTSERRAERRGVIKRISKDEIERDRNIDKSLEVSETTFVRPPRVLSTTENIRKAIVNGKVFYDATIREQKELFTDTTRKPKTFKLDDSTAFVTSNNFREQRDLYLNSTRKPKHLRKLNESIDNGSRILQNYSRKAKSLRVTEDSTPKAKIVREERDTFQNNSRKSIRRNDDSVLNLASSTTLREQRDSYFNSSRKAKNLRRSEDTSTPSVISNNNFGKRKILNPRNINPVRRVRRVYRKRYNPEEVRKRLLERDRNKTSTEPSRKY